MKLLNILGAVVAVHIAVLVLAIAIPGCRTNGKSQLPMAESNQPIYPAPSSNPISAAPEMTDADLNPALVSDVPTGFDPNAPAMTTSVVTTGRASPTRPSSSVGRALQPQRVETAPNPVKTYTVARGDNLWTLARKNNLSVRELASANGLAANAGLRVGQVLVIPGTAPSPVAQPAAAMAPAETGRSYRIRPGDTLGKIAQAHGTTVGELKAFNRLSSDMVRAGDTLSIPESATVQPAAEAPPAAPATVAARTIDTTGAYKHTVAPGESLTVIAGRYGVKIGDIALANKIRDPSLIRPGQELVIPGWEAPAAPAVEQPVRTLSVTPATTAIPTLRVEEQDLDAGFDDEDLGDIPVITVEEAPTNQGDGSPPVFE
ncbi:MAG: hypothetical protein SynsKO_44470 [Synoicihabitans sp.]